MFDSSLPSVGVPSGSLVNIVQRGLLYIDTEARAANNEPPAENGNDCKMSLLEGEFCVRKPLYISAAHLNIYPEISPEQMLPHSPTGSGTDVDVVETPAGDENKQAISPNPSSTNPIETGHKRISLPNDPAMSVEILLGYFAEQKKRSGPLESLPNLNIATLSNTSKVKKSQDERDV
ncbi:unnamed protein product [Strongylus vulgaris]|uniref:Uncharacterized protein n=1 Tax=Strongylus vulgaris TaxID=40348 RepID=A0A3P7JTH3_STRVU|nr:unnamed protein product [Strongylus vulgaris]